MINSLLQYSVQKQIPLPGVFAYLDKTDKEKLLSCHSKKQEDLYSYLKNIIDPTTLQPITQNSYDELELINQTKGQLYEQLVYIIYQNSKGKDIQLFLKHSVKLRIFFENINNSNAQELIKSIEISNRKILYWDDYKKQYLMTVLYNLVEMKQILPEFLLCIEIKQEKQNIQFKIILDKVLIQTLKKCKYFQHCKQSIQDINEQQLIQIILESLIQYKHKLDFKPIIISQTVMNYNEICKKYPQNSLSLLYMKLIEQQKIEPTKCLNVNKYLKERISELLVNIYLNYAIKNGIVFPKLISCISSKSTFYYVSFQRNFLLDCQSNTSFGELNYKTNIDGYFQGLDKRELLEEFYEQLLSKKEFTQNESIQEQILKMLELIYEKRQHLTTLLIKLCSNQKIKSLLTIPKDTEHNQTFLESRELLQKIINFAKQSELEEREIRNKKRTITVDTQNGLRAKQVIQVSSQFRVRFFTPLHKQSRTVELDYTKDQRLKARQNACYLMRLLVNHNKPLVEFLRYIYFKNKVGIPYITLTVPNAFILYLDKDEEYQEFIKQHLNRENKEVIHILDFNYTDLKIDPAIQYYKDQEIILNMIILSYKHREKYIEKLADIFASKQVNVLMSQLNNFNQTTSRNSQLLKEVGDYMNAIDQYIKSYS